MPRRSGDAILMPTHHTNAKRVCPACRATGASTGTRAGEAPTEARVVAGGKGALEGRVTRTSSHHRVPPAPGVQDENVDDHIKTWTPKAATSIS
jgi:hypothetical protein